MSSIDMRTITNPGLIRHESKLKDSNLPVINFSDYLAEQNESIFSGDEKNAENSTESKTIEIRGKKYNLDDIQFAVVDLTQRFTPTGDPEEDRRLAAKYDYFDSCTDYTNAGDFDKITANEDFTGMTTAEIYKAIYEKYQHCYGENFLEAGAIIYDAESPVVRSFNDEINENCGKYYEYDVQKIRRELLYGNATAHDVRQQILDKYTEDGNITMRNLFKANSEMNYCGVGCGFGANNILMYIESDADNVFDYDKEDHFALRQAKLDTYVTSAALKRMARTVESRINSGCISSSAKAVTDQIIKACSGGYGSIQQMGINIEKMSSNSERTRASFTWLRI